jgi:hypothetical protein
LNVVAQLASGAFIGRSPSIYAESVFQRIFCMAFNEPIPIMGGGVDEKISLANHVCFGGGQAIGEESTLY